MIFDIEADGLLDDATKIHVMAYTEGNQVRHTYDYEIMRYKLLNAKVLTGHNIIQYDIPLLEKILNIKIKAKLNDTLALSWYLEPKRIIHGLDSYGEDFGIPKPKIDNWENLTPEEYAHRCVEDVKINTKVWKKLSSKLLDIYGTKEKSARLLRYLQFKMECAAEQARSGWKLDLERVQKNISSLSEQEQEKVEELRQNMPKVLVYADKSKPAKPFKKDGSLSMAGFKWKKLLKEQGLPTDYDGTVTVLVAEKEPNPGSPAQIKDWLTSLGWVPETFNYIRDSQTLEERRIPQIRCEGEDGKELCPSVLKLANKEPAIKILEGLSVIQHRLAIFKGFLKNRRNGWIKAEISGLTNTLRFKHKTLVNLPGVTKAYGEEIRGCLTSEDGYTLCGSDMSSLEDMTKRHYMYKYDPDYVNEMSKPGFDPHLDLAKFAGMVTQKEIDDWKSGVIGCKNLKPLRTDYKVVNYSATYGVKSSRLARTLNSTKRRAEKLLESFWERNKAIKSIVDDLYVKYVDGDMWLFNPVSELYYSLRHEKDKFSTLNQGTGVYCFDSWVREVRKVRKQLTGQFHDEIISCIKEGSEGSYEILLRNSIDKVNEKLKLNVKLDIDVQFGKTYADIH